MIFQDSNELSFNDSVDEVSSASKYIHFVYLHMYTLCTPHEKVFSVKER